MKGYEDKLSAKSYLIDKKQLSRLKYREPSLDLYDVFEILIVTFWIWIPLLMVIVSKLGLI